MRNKLIALVGFLFVAVGIAYAHTNTTTISRSQIDHPDLGYEGGALLHTAIANIYTKLGDNANSRYQEFSGIANSSTQTITHNLGVAIDELQVLLYTGNHPNLTRVADPAGSGWTIAAGATPKEDIDITTPGSGGPHTFAVIIIHGKGSEVISDLDDVNVTAPVDGQVLTYDGTAGEWQNKDPETATGGVNLLTNPGWEKSPDNTGYSVTGGTLAITSTEGEYLAGTQSSTWDSNANGQFYDSDLVNVPLGLEGGSCSVQIRYLADGIATGDYTLDVLDGANNPINAQGAVDFQTTTGKAVFIYKAFICPTRTVPATPAQIKFRITSTVADAALLTLDTGHLGDDIREGTTTFTGWNVYEETEVSVTSAQGGFSVETDTWFKPEKVANGDWYLDFNIVASFTPVNLGSVGNVTATIAGVTFDGDTGLSGSLAGSVNNQLHRAAYALGGSGDVRVNVDNTSSTVSFFYASGRAKLTGKPTWAEDVLPKPSVTLETQGWIADVYLEDSNGQTSTPAAQTVITDTDYVSFTTTANTAVVQQLCSSTDAPVAIGGNCPTAEVRGFRVKIPYSGTFSICVHEFFSADAGTSIRWDFARIDPTDSAVVLEQFVSGGAASPNTGRHYADRLFCNEVPLTAGDNDFAVYADDGGAGVGFLRADATTPFKVTIKPSTQNFTQAIALPQDKYQTKFDTPTGQYSVVGVIETFNNLVPGREYTVSYFYRCLNDFGADTAEGEVAIGIRHDGNELQRSYCQVQNINPAGGVRDSCTPVGQKTFTATTTTVTTEIVILPANISCQSNEFVGVATIIEHNHMIPTTDF